MHLSHQDREVRHLPGALIVTQLRHPTGSRRGVTLLEVMTATVISAAMMTSSMALLRTNYKVWQAHEADIDRSANAAALLRHLVQHVRQAAGVTAITAASNPNGSLAVALPDGTLLTWAHSGTNVTLRVNSGITQPLASDIQTLAFVGYEADGLTPTVTAGDTQTVRVVLTTLLPAGGTRTYSSCVWVRSW
jgi:prepilin-type N-terminal cleavage/methylation domain-containing protein